MGFVKAGSFLARIAKKYKFQERQKIPAVWEKALRRKTKHTRLVKLDRNILLVEVDSSVYMQELSLEKEQLKAALNKKLGKERIRDIHFILRSDLKSL